MGNRCSIWDALRNLYFLKDCRPQTQKAITEFVAMMKHFADIAHTKSADYASMTTKLIEENWFRRFLASLLQDGGRGGDA